MLEPPNLRLRDLLRRMGALSAIFAAGILLAPRTDAITINDNYTPGQIVDTQNVTGVGQMVIDEQNGYIGLCTATLIDPRTVIFSSHCVNEAPNGKSFEPATGYGAAFGGYPIGFGFQSDNRQSITDWFNSGYQTNTSDQFYNSNYVVYNPLSLELGIGANFLQSDVAMAALDTPAVGVPTWTLLFSPLTGPTHATIEGYGENGTGSSGASGGIDYRRRVAENIISVLGSLDNQDLFLYGPPPDGLPQNLYMLDFNDPKYGTAQANQYDFNIYHDAALQLEGITAPGDSGGPLIVDQMFSMPVIAGVLSGGDSFYQRQPVSSYGTTSFYQPLYLFWDWIVANNPYKYVSAKPGNGDWFDPKHWVMNLDPNYVTVDSAGKLVNALPTTPAQGTPTEGVSVNTPKFGSICYYNDCVDIATGVETVYSSSSKIPSDSLSGGPAQVAIADLLGPAAIVPTPAKGPTELDRVRAMFATLGLGAAPGATSTPAEGSALAGGEIVQGAPGSSGFVPNDDDGNPASGRPARYYDVTLSAAGTTTLDNNVAIIDRLTIDGADTGLTIGPDGGLATLIDTTMYAGTLEVDGVYTSFGDIALMGGVLSGSGVVLAPYTTAVLGAIAPGTVGTIGDLSIVGNVILSSGSGLLIDLGRGSNDRLDVSGQLSVGGTVVFSPVRGYVPRYLDTAVFDTASTISNKFNHVPDTIPGVLYPSVTTKTVTKGSGSYDENIVTIKAATFASQLAAPTNDQLQVGKVLDDLRRNSYDRMSALYQAIDPMAGKALSSSLDSLVPNEARVLPLVSRMMTHASTSYLWQHLGQMAIAANPDETTFQVQTSALDLVQNEPLGSPQTRTNLANLARLDPTSPFADPGTPRNSDTGATTLPRGMGGFLMGSSLTSLITLGGDGGKADVGGYIVAGGIDAPIRKGLRFGISLAVGEAAATLRYYPDRTTTKIIQGMVYAAYTRKGGWFTNAFAGDSGETIHVTRNAVVGNTVFPMSGQTGGNTPMFGFEAGRYFNTHRLLLAPAVGLQYQRSQVSGYTENGGIAAMRIDPRQVDELDLRAGLDAFGAVHLGSAVLKPSIHAFLVDSISAHGSRLDASLVSAPATAIPFGIGPWGSGSRLWAELGAAVDVAIGKKATLGIQYNADAGGRNTFFGAWTGMLHIRF